MALTTQQIKTAIDNGNTLFTKVMKLNDFFHRIEIMINNPDITLTDAQKTSLFAQYQTLKQDVITATNNLS